MASDKQIVAFKLGARARKLAQEDCLVEAYELLYTAMAEAESSGDTEMLHSLRLQLEKLERGASEMQAQGTETAYDARD